MAKFVKLTPRENCQDLNSCIKILRFQPGAVAHACNPSYSEGRHQEYGALRLTQAKSSQDPSQSIS
jgi:hypothetical protein